MTVALIFPGQGSQYPGMDRDLDRSTFEEADDALGFALSALIREGHESELQRTEITQPAIFTVSIARLRHLRATRPELQVAAAAGHSLGEYGALVAAGSMEFADAVRLLRLRGQAMQDAVPHGAGGMAAVMGLEAAQVEALCVGAVEVAAYNSHNQVSIAGPVADLEATLARVEEARGVAKLLAVSAPFHCTMLAPAGERLREALAAIPIAPPVFPVVQNVDADVTNDPDEIRRKLVLQVSRPVRWDQCFRRLHQLGATRAIEVGPGRTLAGLGKRIERGFHVEVSDS